MNIESGAPAASRNYWLVVAVVGLAMSAYFAYDGAIGYPNKNRDEAKRQFAGLVDGPLELGETPTKADVEALLPSLPSAPDAVRQKLGKPTYRKDEGGGVVVEQFASLYGLATVRIQDGRVMREGLAWQPWAKTKDDIHGQYYWAALPGLLLLYGLFRFYKSASLRVLVDDTSLTYDGERIPYDSMRDLRDYNPKGWVDLHYVSDSVEKKLRLDNQRIEKFDQVVAAICEKKGFANPLHPAAAPPQ